MGTLKPIGSEKLKGDDKIKRIIEIAQYGNVEKNNDYHVQTTSFTKKGADGNLYAIIQERDGYYLKTGINESKLDYVSGFMNKKKDRFKSYSSALKRMNLIFKPLNEEHNDGKPISMYEQWQTVDLGEQDKFVLNVPDEGGEEEVDVDMDVDMEGGDEEMDMDVDMEDEMGDEEMDMEDDMEDDMEGEEPDMEGFMKSIQKLTGKLGQKLRDVEEEMGSEDIKYVLNSIISAVELENLDDEDMEDIVARFEEDDEAAYGDEEEMDVDMDIEDEMGDEEIDMEDDMGDEDMEMEDEEEVTLESTRKDKNIISEQRFMRSMLKAIRIIMKEIRRDVMRSKKDLTAEQLATLTMLIALPAATTTALGVGISTLKMWKSLVKAKGKYEEYNKLSDDTGETTDAVTQGGEPAMESLKNRVSNLLESYIEKKNENFDPKEFISNKLNENKIKKEITNNSISVEQEIKAHNFIKENRNFKFTGKTKRKSLVFVSENEKVLINARGLIN